MYILRFSYTSSRRTSCLFVLLSESGTTPLGAVVLLHDVRHLLAGEKEVPRLVELQVDGIVVQHVEVFLRGRRGGTGHFVFIMFRAAVGEKEPRWTSLISSPEISVVIFSNY